MTDFTPAPGTPEPAGHLLRTAPASSAQAERLPLHSPGTRQLIVEPWRRPTPMSEFEDDDREIESRHEQYNARLIRRVDQTDNLATFWVKFDGEPTPFEPGQYMTIGVYADGKLVQRPYSVASPPPRRATTATSSTSAWCPSCGSPRSCGACRSATGCA